MTPYYDLIIIGSGPGGYRAAILATLRKLNVAIIEKQDWGGCCLNRGCVPKKAWHHTAKIISNNKQHHKIGVEGNLKANFAQAWQHQRETVDTIKSSYLNYMNRLGISIFEGIGTIKNNTSVQVIADDDKVIETLFGSHIIIATGSSTFTPDLFQIDSHDNGDKNQNDLNFNQFEKRVINTDDLFDHPPPSGDKVAIIGSGVVAVEFAFILQQLGKDIHWYARSTMLKHSDFSPQAIKLLKTKMADDDLHCLKSDNFPIRVSQFANEIEFEFSDGNTDKFSWVLLATGRSPFTDKLGLQNTSIKLDHYGFIQTNEYLQTSEKNIYAIGDCRSKQMTANQAIADAVTAVDNIINGNSQEINEDWVPQAIYSRLEMAKIGLNEEMAEDNNYEPAIGFSAFESSPLALGQASTEGYVRLISDMDSGKFLGGEIVGDNAAEMIQTLSIQTDHETTLKSFSRLTVNHPSRTEELVNATETMASKWQLTDFIFSE